MGAVTAPERSTGLRVCVCVCLRMCARICLFVKIYQIETLQRRVRGADSVTAEARDEAFKLRADMEAATRRVNELEVRQQTREAAAQERVQELTRYICTHPYAHTCIYVYVYIYFIYILYIYIYTHTHL